MDIISIDELDEKFINIYKQYTVEEYVPHISGNLFIFFIIFQRILLYCKAHLFGNRKLESFNIINVVQ